MKSKISTAIQLSKDTLNNKTSVIEIAHLKSIILAIIRCMESLNLFSDNQDNTEISFLFCFNNEIQELNRIYRNKDYSTDVLAFPLNSDGIIGDIAISLEKAEEQSKQLELSMIEEIQFLIIHGILHLIGYDHERSEDDERIMQQLEQQIRNKLRNEVSK